MDRETDFLYRQWHHAPAHLFVPDAFYSVTAATMRKSLFFDSGAKLDVLQRTLFEECERLGWILQAWAIMANHYHFIARAPEDAETLEHLIRSVHSRTARWLNAHDKIAGRKVWFQYWDTSLTHEGSYLARLHYVHWNPVKHRLVSDAARYPWCSMAWFQGQAVARFRQRVLSTKTDRVTVKDDFDLVLRQLRIGE